MAELREVQLKKLKVIEFAILGDGGGWQISKCPK